MSPEKLESPLQTVIDYWGQWHITIFAGLAFLLIFVIRPWLLRRVSFWATSLWCYVALYSLLVIEFPDMPQGMWTPDYRATAGQVLAEIVIIPGSLLLLGALWEERIFALILPAVFTWEVFRVWVEKDGLLVAPSFDTAFIALMLPFLDIRLIGVGVVTCLFHHGSTAYAVLGAELLGFAWFKERFRAALLFAVPILILMAQIHTHSTWFDGGERLAKWSNYMTHWATKSGFSTAIPEPSPWHWGLNWHRILWGAGPGAFQWDAMVIDRFKPPYFLSMHSDWLQILFELGTVGLLLTIAMVGVAIRSASRVSPRHLAAVLGTCAFGLTYHPLRWFPTALLIALIFRPLLVQDETG